MKIARFQKGQHIAHGLVQGNKVMEVRGNIFGRFRSTDLTHKLQDIRLLPPTDPSQVWCPGLNFPDHILSHTGGSPLDLPPHPTPWQKGRGSVIATGQPIVIPCESDGDVHYEGEAVAVIGRSCRRVSPEEALDYVLGYTCANDVSDRSWQSTDHFMWRAKGSDTFGPVGPWIETKIDPTNLAITVRLNGEVVQQANTRDMIHGFAAVISYISQFVTLAPGDLVLSGAPGATQAMRPGDVVEVDIQGIGILRNSIEAEVP